MPYRKNYLAGIRLMLASAAAFSIMGLCVKLAVVDIHPLQVVFFRSFFGLLIISGMLAIERTPARCAISGKLYSEAWSTSATVIARFSV